tara:strand:+ start:104 stop:517 length:414 start_codon:yes stop_codon:yes gene_type:complete
MNKEQLETNMAALKLLQSETNDKARSYQNQIAELEKQIEDINKPELTPKQLDNIHEVVENVVNDFNFEDTGNYNIEYELDYDGRVNASSLEFQSSYELVELIVDKVSNLFKEADCPEDKEAEELSDELNKKHGYETN